MVFAAAFALALAGCTNDGKPSMAAQPRGATVAFESIDGPPPGQFRSLVRNLNDEAQSRQLAVISRESSSAYRVRGYLAAKVVKGQTMIAWVWDVFDNDERRALRISGEETAKGRHGDAWSVADEAMLRKIARASVEQLATFLTSPEAVPNGPAAPDGPQLASVGEPQLVSLGSRDSSPEAAGIFRVFQANADPVATETAEAPQAGSHADSVPLPRRRPASDAAVSSLETLTLAASSH
jgi:hypothetical protein